MQRFFRVRIHTGPLNISEMTFVNRLKEAGFSEVHQGTEYVYGSFRREVDANNRPDFWDAIKFAGDAVKMNHTPIVQVLGSFDEEENAVHI